MNARRAFLVVCGAGAFAAVARSFGQQQARIRRVGFLGAGTRNSSMDEFPRAMRELGYEEGKDLVIEWRFADGRLERLASLAAELIGRKVEIIVTPDTPSTRAAQVATSAIPIVMASVGDPVASGFVASLGRPGGNITGLSLATTDTSAKWLELARIVAPNSRVAILANPNQQTAQWHIENVQAGAKRLGIAVLVVHAATPDEIERAFGEMDRGRAKAVIILPNYLFITYKRQIAEFALKFRMASIATSRVFAEDGALLSYGQNYAVFFRRAATYVDKILKGAKPNELPVEQPTILELVVNLATAKKLGFTIPQELMLRADRVIE